MSACASTSSSVPVRDMQVSVFKVPTDAPESDGTLRWTATTVVVVQMLAGDCWGLGYTYTDRSAAGLIRSVLADAVLGHDAMSPQAAWGAMVDAVRNIGSSGLVSSAIAAVDGALWDLKARLLDLPLCRLLGQVTEAVPVYGSGGFTSYSRRRLVDQLGMWVEQGIPRVKMKIGRHPDQDPERVRAVREAIGAAELMVDANGAYERKQALAMAERFVADAGVAWLEEPVSSDDLEGLAQIRERTPAGMSVAAGEYGYRLDDFQRLLSAGAVDVLQADVTRCSGITGLLQVDALCAAHHVPLSLHCAPAMHLHPGLALRQLMHCEYFHDHVRIERLLFEGVSRPAHGALAPDMNRPGNGLELRHSDAERYAI